MKEESDSFGVRKGRVEFKVEETLRNEFTPPGESGTNSRRTTAEQVVTVVTPERTDPYVVRRVSTQRERSRDRDKKSGK